MNNIKVVLVALFFSTLGYSKQYKPDFAPLENSDYAEAYQKLVDEHVQLGAVTRENAKSRAAILEKVMESSPWEDGYWLLANTYMQIGETTSSSNEKEVKAVRATIVKAENLALKCLKLNPKNIICKFLSATSSAKIGTIDGMFASLGRGKYIEQTWNEVLKSDTDYNFVEGYSLQSLNRYVLGIFYRAVPDSFLLDWLFGFRGNIDRSVELHAQNIETASGKDSACAKFEFVLSALCKTEGDKSQALTKKAFKLISEIESKKSKDESELICINDVSKIRKDPSLACGYTKAKQQERDESKIKK